MTAIANATMSEDSLSRKVAAAYAADAADYRELWAPVLHPIASGLVAELPAGRRVLDMGTGVGTLLPHLRQRLGARLVVGVDLTTEMLSLADPDFARIVGDAARAPFASATFDVVVLPFVLFHLDQPLDALAEARRMLRPGGAVGTITWESDSGSPALEAWSEELTRHGAPEQPPVSHHDPVDRPEKVSALLDAAGFTEVNAWTLVHRDEVTVDEFVQRRLRLGSGRRRLHSLAPDARRACVAAATERVARLEPKDFWADWRFVLATARA